MDKQCKILSLAFLMLILTYAIAQSQEQQYRFRHITTEEGMPTNKTWMVLKDSRGFIWFGTRGGLCRYDGYDIRVYEHIPGDTSSLSNNWVTGTRRIAEDDKGHIWVGTFDGLNKFDPVTGKFTRYLRDSKKPGKISSNRITYIHTDISGVLWIGTGLGLNKYRSDSDNFDVYWPNANDRQGRENSISSIYEEFPGKFWIGTYDGLFKFDCQSEVFQKVNSVSVHSDTTISIEIKTIFKDVDGTMLFGTQNGFMKLDETNQVLIPSYPFFNKKARINFLDIASDPVHKNTLWVTNSKLFKYDKDIDKQTYFFPEPDDPESILGQVIYSIYFDDAQMMWVAGTRGVNTLKTDLVQIKKHLDFFSEYGRDASFILKDSRGHLWVSTHGEKLIHFDQDMGIAKQYDNIPVEKANESSNLDVSHIMEDSKGNIWVGTNRKGLFYIENGNGNLIRSMLKTRTGVFNALRIYDIYEDSQGVIWVSTTGGPFWKGPGQPISTFERFYPDSSITIGSASGVYEDSHGWLWIGTFSQGLFYQPRESRNTGKFIHLNHDPDDERSLSHQAVWVIYEDPDSNLWVATEKGLNRFIREEGIFERYMSETIKGANCIWDMTGDKRGYLWMTTEAGLIKTKPNTSDTGHIVKYKIKKVLPFRDIFLKQINKDSDGKIYVPGADYSGNGYFSFHPDSLEENQRIPPVYITGFSLQKEPFVIDTSIILKKHLRLKHYQNFFSFKFAALDYSNPVENRYAYYLEGLEEDWIYCDDRRLANYTAVPPGDYIFRVKGSNNDGYWNETGASVHLTVLSPPWKTWWAYTSYGVIIIIIIYTIIKYYLRRQKLVHSLELKQVQTEKLEELDRMKSRFFANISHEFRTPLTLILGPLQNLLFQSKDEKSKQDISIMQRNAIRLQNLINQLLNLSKLESGQLKLKAREENIVTLVKQYIQSFESYARQKRTDLTFKADEKDIRLYVDKEKMEKILYNILSNAFKFTPEGGRIEVKVLSFKSLVLSELTKDQRPKTKGSPAERATISITDNGPGISPTHLPHIFNRFYQADDSYSKDQEGTGIGLALTKELVELHHGEIKVVSESGKGTTFTVLLPLGKEHLKEQELDDSRQLTEDSHKLETQNLELKTGNLEPGTRNPELGTRTNVPILLIVEDNADLRHYIRGFLEGAYEILECENGNTGYQKATEIIPDLVISDVMMPEMDGYELCRKLKTDERTSHIPVILLTARADMDSKIEGLETGADDFITKPFDPLELQTRIKNLVKQRIVLQERFNRNIRKLGIEQMMKVDAPDFTSIDQRFFQKAIDLILHHLSESEYNIEILASEMSLSRRQLHRKIVSLTGNSPVRFIRSIRLNRAAEMLAKKTGNVTEIAFEVGFNNLSWFAKSFKEQFGVLPSEYKGDKPEN